MIIDSHVHIFPPEIIRDRRPHLREESQFALIYENPQAAMGSAEDLVRVMDQDQVDKALVCGFPWSDPGRTRDHNDYILESAARYPDRLVPLACLDPLSSQGLAEAERTLSLGFAGLGELSFYDRDLADPKAHESLVQVAQLCAEADKPLMIHTNEPVGHVYPGKAPMTLKGLYDAVKACPRTRFQLAHLGGGLFFYELLKKEVKEVLRNCVFDTAAAPFLYTPRIYPAFAFLAGAERLLFGTDWPLLRLPRYLKDIQASGLGEEDKAAHLGGNAAAFWRI